MIPNVKTNLIKCEYSLKASSYFDYSVLGKDRLRIEMPIYVTYQLKKENEYERDTNQKNGQGQEFAPRDFQKEFGVYGNKRWGNNNNNNRGNNNNNKWEIIITTVAVTTIITIKEIIIIIWETIRINLEEIIIIIVLEVAIIIMEVVKIAIIKEAELLLLQIVLKNSLMKHTLPRKKWINIFSSTKMDNNDA